MCHAQYNRLFSDRLGLDLGSSGIEPATGKLGAMQLFVAAHSYYREMRCLY
jgi:hypothetical protein